VAVQSTRERDEEEAVAGDMGVKREP